MDIGKIQQREITEEMRESYLDYAMSVIVARALPDVRDGLKPVHRRILYSMHEMGLTHGAKFRKSAAIVGDCLGKYHPHGDMAVYETMVRMAQNFSLRYPLVDGQGNFGCFTKDTKVKLTDGREASFKELVEEYKAGKQNFTYTINKLGLISIAEIKYPRLTRKNAELVRVTLDNGAEIRCTPNHLFMQRDGSYTEAQYLITGDSLMPLYERNSEHTDRLNREGYLLVYQLKKNEWTPAHYLADNYKGNKNHTHNTTGKKKFLAICKEALQNNQSITAEAYEFSRKAVYPYGAATKWETGLKKYFQNNANLILQEINQNHKVIRVERLPEHEDVYDLTIDGTHNFALASGIFVHNSIDGDSAAAPRYTEARLTKIAEEMLRDIEKDTVNFRPNYDDTREEPSVLPSLVPNLLLNGTIGIAVGMATNIPPHNLTEVVSAIGHLIDHPKATSEDMMEFIKGPDFPTGGIMFNEKEIRTVYASGRGAILNRGKAEIEERDKGYQIIITEIPYQVNKSELIIKMAELVTEKKIDGIRDIRDESDKDGLRIAIDLKQDAQPQKVLNNLYTHTDLEKSFHLNMLSLVDGIQPQVLSIKEVLGEFVKHRNIVVTRRTKFDLTRARERIHILEGLKSALDHIDQVISTIKKSENKEEAHVNLMKKFALSDIQATAILEMRLQTLAGLEHQKIEDELKEKLALARSLEALLKDPSKILALIKKELAELKDNYGDPRRTRLVKSSPKEFSEEDLIPDEEVVVVLTRGGYIKRIKPDNYRMQKRGGKGLIGMETKEEDVVEQLLATMTHAELLFFTNSGKVYQVRAYEVPEGTRVAKGRTIFNFLSLNQEERITSILAIQKAKKGDKPEGFVVMLTKDGVIKKVESSVFESVRRSGLIAITLDDGDELRWAKPTMGADELILVTEKGQSIRFSEKDVRAMGRQAAGVSAIRLKKEDQVVGMDVVENAKIKSADAKLLVVMSNGYGKQTALKQYKKQKRGGSGIKTAKITPKVGRVVGARIPKEEETELIAISKKGQVIRTELATIPSLSRATQGVRIMRLEEGDTIASMTTL